MSHRLHSARPKSKDRPVVKVKPVTNSYQQKKLGISGLQRYQSDKALISYDKPAVSRITLKLTEGAMERDLAKLSGKINTQNEESFRHEAGGGPN